MMAMDVRNIALAQWSAPKQIFAGVTLRSGGISTLAGDEQANNMALHVNDGAEQVMRNRRALAQQLNTAMSRFQWLNQVHGTHVAEVVSPSPLLAKIPDADAVISRIPGVVCCVMTADCLPILLCNKQGTEVAAIHAGWRSLCGNDNARGIIENTVAKMHSDASELIAWFGPAISQAAFEVGQDVYDAFAAQHDNASEAFKASEKAGKYFADLTLLARQRLADLGITLVAEINACSVAEKDKWFSYRRDGETGRMASFIGIYE